MNRDGTTTVRHTNSAAGAADSNLWTTTLYEMVYNDQHASTSDDKTRDQSMRADSPILAQSREKLRPLVQVEVMSVVETVEREKMRVTSQDLVEKTICEVFAAGYCAVIEDTNSFSYSFVENVIKEMIHGGVQVETLNQSFSCCSRSDIFMQVLVEKIVHGPGLPTPGTLFVRQRVIHAVEESHKQESQITKKILSPPGYFPSASTKIMLDKESKARSSRRKRRDRKHRKYRDSSKMSCETAQTSPSVTVIL